MFLFTLQNLSLINTFLIVLVTYFMIGFIIYSIRKSDIQLLNAVAESVKKGARGRKDLLEQQASHKSELMSSFLWPKAFLQKLKTMTVTSLNQSKIMAKLRQLKSAKSKEDK